MGWSRPYRIGYNQNMDASKIERETHRIGREILAHLKRGRHSLFQKEWWQGRVLRWCMENEPFKIELFRFIDVLPNLKNSADIVRIFREYFDRPELGTPPLLSWGMKTLIPGSPTVPLAAAAIRTHIEMMAGSFIAGRDLAGARGELERMERSGETWTVSMLGEAAVNEEESGAYLRLYLDAIEQLARRPTDPSSHTPGVSDRFGTVPHANLAVKLSSLYSQMDPVDWEGTLSVLTERLVRLLTRSRALGLHLHLDMEHYAFKDLILETFFRAMSHPELSGFRDAGIVVQAYLRDSAEDLEKILAWAAKNRPGITVRLVRGAYWDYEKVIHRQNGWPVPVYLAKGETDAHYERLTDRLLSAPDTVRTAFGTHNVRSLAHAIASARSRGIPDREYEIQLLFGMGGPLQAALDAMGLRVRIYTPVGDLITGMAYLVRRLLENTSNESFLRNFFVDGTDPESVLAEPTAVPAREPEVTGFQNEPPLDFRIGPVRSEFSEAIASVRKQLGRDYPLLIGGKPVVTDDWIASVNPARPSEVVGRAASAGTREADRAVAVAGAAAVEWARRPAGQRAEILRNAAGRLQARRMELSAWEVFEVGKTWREADRDVTEAIDFLRYYADEVDRLDPSRKLGDYPGERNLYSYFPIGIGVVIAPWNFPLAIPAGMVSAALAAGNAVLFKPSELSPVMGYHLVHAFSEAGLPDGVLSYLPGRGEVAGEHLVRHPSIGLIAFTGSRKVGLGIIEQAARLAPGQRHVKRVVAEMGGKNAIIVDETADLDLAVPGIVQSAVGFQGQKCSACSRVIVLESVYDAFLHRLVGALKSLHIGPPEEPSTELGPVIEAAAQDRLRKAVEAGAREGKVILQVTDVPTAGFYVGPAVIADLAPESRIATEEMFGPIVAVIRAKDLDEAIRIANSTDYALTGGLYSRSPAAIERVTREMAAGNLYINRGITGALVGRQPFGGYRLSGVGSKAGGPDYLLQFMIPKVVTENTLRRGFAPTD
jgi:RHH-type transcriptional regulator, proline utilization regulon repressor / proline dehydrogenase / delta 1-pyrroline-5-carboxylate dehydrogenase